jgi:hypothetical protein
VPEKNLVVTGSWDKTVRTILAPCHFFPTQLK